MRKIASLTFVFALTLALPGCEYRYEKMQFPNGHNQTNDHGDAVSFEIVSTQVLEPKCATCHNSSTDFDICNRNIASATKEGILQRISSHGRGQMPPPGAPQLTPEEKSLINKWIHSESQN